MNGLSTDELIAQATCAVLIDGQIVGTAWLVSEEGDLLTAGHVLGTDSPLSEVNVKFSDDIPRKAYTINLCIYEEKGINFSVLKLISLNARKPLPISLNRSVSGRFRACGQSSLKYYKLTFGEGEFVGAINRQNSANYRLFRLRSPELAVEGFSGSAIYSDELGAVVAIQIEAPMRRIGPLANTTLAMPLYRIAELWEPLNELNLHKFKIENISQFLNSNDPSIDTTTDPPTTEAFAMANIKEVEDGESLEIETQYKLLAGILREIPEGVTVERFHLPDVEEVEMDVVVRASGFEILPDWHQRVKVIRGQDSDLLEFILVPKESGDKKIEVEFLYERHWLTAIVLDVTVVAPDKGGV